MKEEIKKIEGIVNELVSNALHAKATDVQTHIVRDGSNTTITVKDNGIGMDDQTVKKIHRLLNQPNKVEFEDVYGGLSGNRLSSSGLHIVGMLVDEANVISQPGKGTEITVFRRKK